MSEPVKASEVQGGPLPRVAVCMGDPAGIGPEILVKALADPEIYRECRPVVLGDARVLAGAPGWQGEPRFVRVSEIEQARPEPGVLSVIDLANVPATLKPAVACLEGGKASIEYLTLGAKLCLEGRAEAVVSAPFNKEAMKKTGFHFLDEYEYLADLCKTTDYTVIQAGPRCLLASVTLHVPMAEMATLITKDRVLSTIRYSAAAARAAGIAQPRSGVAGFNAHAGDGGTLGREEVDALRPAVEAARAEGIDAYGPFPADTFFMTLKKSAYDVYVGMYHDQGRIAMKMLDFGRIVTMSEGLPLLFTTVGHGTAYDIVGKGIANHENMKEAILLGARRALTRRGR